MASKKPPPPSSSTEAMEHQDQSIKVRKSQLFETGDEGAEHPATRPFTEYLKDTPATPLSGLEKAGLWAAAVVVGLLLLAALFHGRNKPHPRQPQPRGVQTGNKSMPALADFERRRADRLVADRPDSTSTFARRD